TPKTRSTALSGPSPNSPRRAGRDGDVHRDGPERHGPYTFGKLPPTYTPFGKLDKDSLKNVEKVGAAGVEGGAGDGAPKKAVEIEKATVKKS
ncbi:peptidylprolyl isomerase, partial [Streptomyces cyaneofuscatus]